MKAGKMPPWYADKCCGQFSTEHALKPEEIATIEAWASTGALEGKKKDAPRPVKWTDDWKIDGPSVVLSVPRAFEVPANSKVEDPYIILPLDLAEDKWASAVEIHPGDRSVVQDAILYVRTKDSSWLRNYPARSLFVPQPGEAAQQASADILAVYAAGNPAAIWPDGMGKRLPAGSDLVLRIHYASKKTAASDRSSIGINFLPERPKQRVLTLPFETSDSRPFSSGVIPQDAVIIGFFARMPVRAKGFEYAIVPPNGKEETLLTVSQFDPFWQVAYPLKTFRVIPKGTRLEWTGHFNPGQSETAIGYIDVAVGATSGRLVFTSTPNR
jgi:hypothetical protein